MTNTRILLARRPVGWVDTDCFRIEACPEPDCGPEDVLVEAVWLSLDPYLRGRMNEGPSYAPGFEIGRPIVSRVVGRVLASRNARFAEGEYVWGFLDWALRTRVPRGEGLTNRGIGRGHGVQAVAQRLEVQHGAAHQQRQAATTTDLGGQSGGIGRETRCGVDLRRLDEIDQVVRYGGPFSGTGFGRADVHAAVDEGRVDADDLDRQLGGQGQGHGGLAAGRWPGQADAQRLHRAWRCTSSQATAQVIRAQKAIP
jgi:hypothetical protein